jgi:hypothetical protein
MVPCRGILRAAFIHRAVPLARCHTISHITASCISTARARHRGVILLMLQALSDAKKYIRPDHGYGEE